jgi:hypothetical protein
VAFTVQAVVAGLFPSTLAHGFPMPAVGATPVIVMDGLSVRCGPEDEGEREICRMNDAISHRNPAPA